MHKNIELITGLPFPLGSSTYGDTTNFAVFSSSAKQMFIGLGDLSQTIYPMNRTGDIWHIGIKRLPPKTPYAFKTDLRAVWLLDPYAKIPNTDTQWGKIPQQNIRAIASEPVPFDWENIKRPNTLKTDTIIYEMHVRGFTKQLDDKFSGTYQAIIEKIPHLLKLGITAVQFLPIFEFDECHSKAIHPETKQRLPNYWGYNPLSYFAPKKSFSASGDPVFELKTLIKELHKNNIEVILDVVYNHTGEGSEKDYIISWRGLDSNIYYLLRDYTGCGNTINANHPQVEKMILDSLRYFAEEFHIDGFRFDLASTFLRAENGEPLENSSILQAISKDPILSGLKLIAEPWDASGLYHVGHFPKLGPWSEWNGKFRDAVRRFIKGTDHYAHQFAEAICGSSSLYQSPLSSINFITAHDGFTLRDLVTYQEKHNYSNGEENRDGNDQNDNWNCGEEGPSSDQTILELRERQMRNHLLALFISRGIPMFLMGDEYGHTRNGNNNPYVQDNNVNWFQWDELKKNEAIFNFIAVLIAFRKKIPILSKTTHLTEHDIIWHGQKPNLPNWGSRFLAFSTTSNPNFYIAFNTEQQILPIELPLHKQWNLILNTKDGWDKHYFNSQGPLLSHSIALAPYSALVAIELGSI